MSNPAETYEREMVPVVFAPWVPLLLELAAPRPGERVLDLACGTGIVARQTAKREGAGARIVGLDLSPGMLAVARDAAKREGASIEWIEGRAEELPFPDNAFDIVICQQGLQFVPERPRAAAEMYRVLADGGRVVVATWRGPDHHPYFVALNDAVVRHLGIPAMAAPFSLGNEAELRGLLEGAGFKDVAIQAHTKEASFPDSQGYIAMQVDVIAAAIPSAQHLDAAARAKLAAAIGDEMAEAMRGLKRDGRMVIPFHNHVARGERRN